MSEATVQLFIEQLNEDAAPILDWVDSSGPASAAVSLLDLAEELLTRLRTMVDNIAAQDYNVLMSALVSLHRLISDACGSAHTEAQVERGPSGQLQYAVDPELLEGLCEQGFTDKQVGEILGWHPRTVIKRRKALGIEKRGSRELS
ncbi:hypothetical protein A4X09_0g1242 [Tilletia walkeri]|uniref:Uncharacterized protein n=1 Tax=Tilletia walkeri TaxID=117179 RepID=A0A8X7NFK6_9BASI|nr:hypothetical protein A4X09_0g1242 [Tilletia walkeri]